MSRSWKLLVELGLPDGAPRPRPSTPLDAEAVRKAVLELAVPGALGRARVAPLLAWLRAWKHHWPARFSEVFGETWRPVFADLERRLDDENRYLKLRRIAVENLSGIL